MRELKWILFLGLSTFLLSVFFCIPTTYSRDPFYIERITRSSRKNIDIKLLGIVESSGRKCAIIMAKGSEEAFFEGDNVYGLKLTKIRSDEVTLTNGKTYKKLLLAK